MQRLFNPQQCRETSLLLQILTRNYKVIKFKKENKLINIYNVKTHQRLFKKKAKMSQKNKYKITKTNKTK